MDEILLPDLPVYTPDGAFGQDHTKGDIYSTVYINESTSTRMPLSTWLWYNIDAEVMLKRAVGIIVPFLLWQTLSTSIYDVANVQHVNNSSSLGLGKGRSAA